MSREELEVVATELARLRAEVAALRGELAASAESSRGRRQAPTTGGGLVPTNLLTPPA